MSHFRLILIDLKYSWKCEIFFGIFKIFSSQGGPYVNKPKVYLSKMAVRVSKVAAGGQRGGLFYGGYWRYAVPPP
jgi:hypothetical protein